MVTIRTLQDVIDMCIDTANIYVYQDGERIAVYDGRNSLPDDLCDGWEVEQIDIHGSGVDVTLEDAVIPF